MKHMKHMIGCVVMIAAVGLLFLVQGGDTPAWLPIVLVLCCPLMMIGMMVMMSRDHGASSNTSETSDRPEREAIRPVDHR